LSVTFSGYSLAGGKPYGECRIAQEATLMNVRQIFLLIVAIGLIPIALSYGAFPQQTLLFLFDITVINTNGTHIFRALMALYLGFALFWILGAFNTGLRQAALLSLIVFMFGIAAGRILSVIIDGIPHWLLMAYLLVEIVFGGIAIILSKRME